MNNDNYIEALIARVLAGEATAAEIAEIDDWKRVSEENRNYFASLERIFITSNTAYTHIEFNEDVAWNKVKETIHKTQSGKVISITPAIPLPQLLFRIAAMLLLVAGLGYTIYTVIVPEKITPVILTSGSVAEDHLLPDSTTVVLNRNSQLVYTYSANSRKAELKGEAYFDLGNDTERPFELTAGTLLIRDIGTSFNVNAPDNGDSVVVIVTDGEVIITSESNKSVSLIKGQQAVYYNSRDEFIQSTDSDTNAIAYKTKIFVFENANLEIIVKKLSEVYDEEIILDGAISMCHLTATFKDETIENILEVIAATLKLEVIKSDKGFILKGEFCEE